MSYMNQATFAPAGGIRELNFDEIDMIEGGSRVSAVLKAIDWLGRALTVKAVVDALPTADM